MFILWTLPAKSEIHPLNHSVHLYSEIDFQVLKWTWIFCLEIRWFYAFNCPDFHIKCTLSKIYIIMRWNCFFHFIWWCYLISWLNVLNLSFNPSPQLLPQDHLVVVSSPSSSYFPNTPFDKYFRFFAGLNPGISLRLK